MPSLHVGCCITSHGFGHAARTMAVMDVLASLVDLELTIVSLVPEWFIRSSYSGTFTLHSMQTDVGLVQHTPLEHDLAATIDALSTYYPVRTQTIESLASVLAKCDVVICDISPSGILAARYAGVPSVLLENFTWDWIYDAYRKSCPEFGTFVEYFKKVNSKADYRIQALPVCDPVGADLVIPPVARAFRDKPDLIRRRLQLNDGDRIVLVSLGGIGLAELPVDRIQDVPNTVFIISGYTGPAVTASNLVLMPPDTKWYHPDLVAASDAVVGKVGYSTVAEVYHADVAFGYIRRQDFRESGPMVSYISKEMNGIEIDPVEFSQGHWVDKVPKLFQLETNGKTRQNGAFVCADFLLSLFEN